MGILYEVELKGDTMDKLRRGINFRSKKNENKPYNHYPRGIVQIKNGCVVIYTNANIISDKLRKWAVEEFNLSKGNGINKIILKADMSNHYLCYLDWRN